MAGEGIYNRPRHGNADRAGGDRRSQDADDSVMSANEYMGQGRVSRLSESAMAPGVTAFD